MSKELIRLTNLTMTFEDGETILDNINLYINNKEFLTLLGPSGCGKTTMLRIIGGFLTPTSGDVLFNGKRINDLPAYQRKINTVFQATRCSRIWTCTTTSPSACALQRSRRMRSTNA